MWVVDKCSYIHITLINKLEQILCDSLISFPIPINVQVLEYVHTYHVNYMKQLRKDIAKLSNQLCDYLLLVSRLSRQDGAILKST